MSPIDRVLHLAHKLRGRDLTELRVRSGQAIAAWRERAGLTTDAAVDRDLRRWLADGAPAAPEALLAERWARRDRPRLFAGLDDREATIDALRRRAPDVLQEIVERADRVVDGRFDLLGYRGLSFGTPIDWHLDPLAGKRTPAMAHWSRVPYLDAAVVGDHKLVWELNRHQYFVGLGQAYWATGDVRYARTIASHLAAWMDANPPKRGINWASSLEVAFRAMSWAWAMELLRDADALTPALYARVLAHLHVHGRHLETFLSTYFSPNTHLTGEALGLVFIGLGFPELRGAARWRRTGTEILVSQLARQVRPDGVYFEQASQYQRYTTEFYLQLHLLAERNPDLLDAHQRADVRGAVVALAEHLQHLARPDGTIPLIGDDDGGRLTQLDGRTPDDVRALLATAAVAFERADLAAAGDGDVAHAVWLLGPRAADRLDALPRTTPGAHGRAFPDGGYWILRSGWERDALHAVVDCGPHGVFNCGHAHADVLSITLSAAGRPLLVDAGTYTYPGPDRNAFRGAASHNGVTVDGEGPSRPARGAFQWERIAHGRPLAWLATPELDLFSGTHDGFAHLATPATHVRDVLRMGDRGLAVHDVVDGAGRRRSTRRWRVAAGVTVRLAAGIGVQLADLLTDAGDLLARLAIVGPGTARVETGWVSPQYGAREATSVIVHEVDDEGRHEVLTLLLTARGIGAPEVSSAPGAEGVVTTVQWPRSGADTPEDDVLVTSEGAWKWSRRGRDGTVRDILHATSHAAAGRRYVGADGEIDATPLGVRTR